jgi:hypothetical protein
VDTYDYLNSLFSQGQKKSYVLKTCHQSLRNTLNPFVSFYSQWNYLPPLLYDFNAQGQFPARPTLVFENYSFKDLGVVPWKTSTIFYMAQDIHTPTQLLSTLQNFITTSLSGWNVTPSIQDHKLTFTLAGIPTVSPQTYVSRTIFAPLVSDFPPPFNQNPLFFDEYNLTVWGFNSLTSQIPRSGGVLQATASLLSVSNIERPQRVTVPYQVIDDVKGTVSTSFYSSIPSPATWVEGCLAISSGFQSDITYTTVGSGGLIHQSPQNIWLTSATLLATLFVSVLCIWRFKNIYVTALCVGVICMSTVALLQQTPETSIINETSQIWTQDGHLRVSPDESPLVDQSNSLLLLQSSFLNQFQYITEQVEEEAS